MKKLTINIDNAINFLKETPFGLEKLISDKHYMIHNKTGQGNDFLGWLELPLKYDLGEFNRIIDCAKKIKNDSDVLVVIGIGGSYLGTKAGLEFLKKPFNNTNLEIVFAGHQMSGDYLNELLEYLKDKDYSLNIISKSGTTTEPAIAFRILKKALEEKYGKETAKNRIYATTDQKRGALHTMAKKEGYEMFVIPDDVGGRFSVLTAVGLLPLACANIDIKKMMNGAIDAYHDFNNPDLKNNAAYLYAATRYLLYKEGKNIEILASYEPNLIYIAEWWKQLFGESEGKDHKGLFVASANFSTDLHSMGQYIQDGSRIIFETIIKLEEQEKDIVIPFDNDDLDDLNYIALKKLSYVNEKALEGTVMAHVDGGVPNIIINLPKKDEYNLGYLFYFFEKACAMSAYLLDVNPFNQPGVEAYKKNMFALLGKKGYKI
ncbi:glucose-6-phosphate isomerase [Acholeplasma sp. OttesenSCG-928-E16]|nr:glucose-6-phosphate isomerase [Acholeplasma sp. OttesenSCG-928-E16]